VTEDPKPADWVLDLMRDFQDRLLGGLYRGLYQLDDEPLRQVMDAQAETCVHAFVALHQIPADLNLDEFVERMKTAGPSRITVSREDDDSLLWTEWHAGGCVCPHVRRGIIPLEPKLCLCGETWVRLLIERHARRKAQVTLVESIATGAENCIYRISLGDALETGPS
jgi:hypothetical protein